MTIQDVLIRDEEESDFTAISDVTESAGPPICFYLRPCRGFSQSDGPGSSIVCPSAIAPDFDPEDFGEMNHAVQKKL